MTVEAYIRRCKPKSCPRCHGDMLISNDEDGWHRQCLQCSHRIELGKNTEPMKNYTPNHAELNLKEKPDLQSVKKYEVPSSIERKKDNLRVFTEEEWQAFRRQMLRREV